jgi:hypothetical protein
MIAPSREVLPIIRATLERGQRVRMTVSGTSMLPFLRDGDVVELEPLGAAPRAGDVVLAQGPAGPCVLHRVVRVTGEGLFLRGDAQEDREGPLAPGDVLGKVTLCYRHGHARAVDRGGWRLAGLVWVSCAPLSTRLLHLARGARAIAGGARRRLRNLAPYLLSRRERLWPERRSRKGRR